jgi:3-hydroxyacyl-CoA dehydrogenase
MIGGTQSAAQRYAFFAERQAGKIPDVPEDTPTRKVGHVGIIGAGTMRCGIAMNFLSTGLPVTIVEKQRDALDRGIAAIRKNYENSANKGKLTQDELGRRMSLLSPSLSLDDLKNCDLTIEAVFELMDLKKKIFGQLNAIAKPGAILASNTSYLDIDEIAVSTSRPEDVIGLHFFAPANVMPLLEIVRGAKTDKSVIATAMQLAKEIRKVAVLVGNSFGFVGNRMLAARQREVQKLLLEGAKVWDIDRVIHDFGMPKPSELVEQVVRNPAPQRRIPQRTIPDEEILERCLNPMINEGAKLLEEGVAMRSSDIDTVWIKGYGWPVYRGGPMYWAEVVGLDIILQRLRELQRLHGDDFKPAPLLERLVAQGKGFHPGNVR